MVYAANSEEAECDGNQQLIDDGLLPIFSPEDIIGRINMTDQEYGRKLIIKFPFKDVETPFGLAVRYEGAGENIDFTDELPVSDADEEKDRKRRERASDTEYKEKDTTSLSAEEKQVWLASEMPATADEISRVTGIPVDKVLTAITMLEIGGYIESLPGGKVMRT